MNTVRFLCFKEGYFEEENMLRPDLCQCRPIRVCQKGFKNMFKDRTYVKDRVILVQPKSCVASVSIRVCQRRFR